MLNELVITEKIIGTLAVILPRTINVFFLVLVLFFIYSVVGVELFCFLKQGDDSEQDYQDFISAFVSLLEFSTL